MYKRILLSLLITFALSNSAKILRAQSLTTGYGHPSVPFQVGNGSLTMQAKITGGAAACSGGTLTIELPAGYGYAGNARTITYTAGIAGAEVPVTATASTVNTASLPIGSIPASPDSMIILYDAYAGCEVVGSTTGNASYELSTPGCSVTSSTATTGGLNVQNAQMNISSVSNSSFTGTIGDIYSRVITIQNGGLGYIDTVYVDDISGSGFSISGAVSSSGTLTREAV